MNGAVREAVPALIELRDHRIVGAVGAGMNFVEPLRRFVAETDLDVVMVAGRWTLVDRSAAPLLDDCARSDVAVVAAAPFNSGLLARPDPHDGAMFDYGPAPQDMLDRARECGRACELLGTELPAAALQFPLRGPAVVSVVAGLRTEAQVESNMRWFNSEIDACLSGELPPAIH